MARLPGTEESHGACLPPRIVHEADTWRIHSSSSEPPPGMGEDPTGSIVLGIHAPVRRREKRIGEIQRDASSASCSLVSVVVAVAIDLGIRARARTSRDRIPRIRAASSRMERKRRNQPSGSGVVASLSLRPAARCRDNGILVATATVAAAAVTTAVPSPAGNARVDYVCEGLRCEFA